MNKHCHCKGSRKYHGGDYVRGVRSYLLVSVPGDDRSELLFRRNPRRQ